jgi:hypothetical protein
LNVPNPWPPAAFSTILDLDSDGRAETLIFALHPEAPPTGLLADLDQSFMPDFTEEKFAAAEGDFDWDFEFGWQPAPERRVFYDTDDNGEFDLIQVDLDGDEGVEISLTLREGVWERQESRATSILDAGLAPADMHARLQRIVNVIRAHGEE